MGLTIYHWILIAAFTGIVVWAFGRKRRARFGKDARIPFDDGKGVEGDRDRPTVRRELSAAGSKKNGQAKHGGAARKA